MARLRRSHLEGTAIRRRRAGRGFHYCWTTGDTVRDPEILERIQALVIPPAWNDVWICPWPNGHIQAVGTDAAGRRQYRYHDEWRRQRDAAKFERMVDFAIALPDVRSSVTQHLEGTGLTRSRVLSLGIRLLDIGMFRVGGEEYAEEHETYGLATLEKRHVAVRGGSATFEYPAKGGIPRLLTVQDPVAVEILAQLKRRRSGGEGLLAWQEEHAWVDVRSHDINAFLREVSGGPFTAKDFRTWNASLLAAVLCAQFRPTTSPSAKARRTAAIVRQVSEVLGNTPAVCRKSYIDPRIIDRFDHGETITIPRGILQGSLESLTDAERCRLEESVVALLDAEPASARAAVA